MGCKQERFIYIYAVVRLKEEVDAVTEGLTHCGMERRK
jgi:hypothetical protein